MSDVVTVTQVDNQRVVVEVDRQVTVEADVIRHVVSAGAQGPKGAKGAPGPAGGSAFERLSAGPLSALRVVWEDAAGAVRLLDYRDEDHIDLLAGVTVTAASSAGQTVTVQRAGPLEAAGMGLVPGRVWLGADGALVQAAPPDGFDVLIGYATSAHLLYLACSEPIELE